MSNRLHPVNTLKHVVDKQNVIAAGTAIDITLVDGVENAVSTVVEDCDIGSYVRSIYLNVQVVNSLDAAGLINNVYMYLYGNPGDNVAAVEIPAVNVVGISDFRKMIFHQEMRMMSTAGDSIPITLFNGVVRIPKKFQRIGIKDKIRLRLGTPTGGAEVDACVQAVYKEIR